MLAEQRTAKWLARLEVALDRALPSADQVPQRLHQAMRHAVLGGGKRLRAQLVYAAGWACGANRSELDAPAVAVELVHGYSLVHDDLPAMDDDKLRRGKPTVHIAFDEATAILAGDALQALAFAVLAKTDAPAKTRIELVATLAEAAGTRGMCGGQQLDMDATGKWGPRSIPPLKTHKGQRIDINPVLASEIALERLHAMKTGALIRASVRMGALVGEAGDELLDLLDDFAHDLGLAFQIRDDILDVETDSSELGKSAGKDAAQDKLTYPALIGMAESKRRLQELREGMHYALRGLGKRAVPLRALAEFAIARGH